MGCKIDHGHGPVQCLTCSHCLNAPHQGMSLHGNHPRDQSRTGQDRTMPLQRFLAARHHQHAGRPGMVRRVILELKIQCHVIQCIRYVLLSLKPHMKLKLDFAQACLHLQAFADNLTIGHRDNGVPGDYLGLFQRPEKHWDDTFGLCAGLIIHKPGWQGFHGIGL